MQQSVSGQHRQILLVDVPGPALLDPRRRHVRSGNLPELGQSGGERGEVAGAGAEVGGVAGEVLEAENVPDAGLIARMFPAEEVKNYVPWLLAKLGTDRRTQARCWRLNCATTETSQCRVLISETGPFCPEFVQERTRRYYIRSLERVNITTNGRY
jgi:hypothetical protein